MSPSVSGRVRSDVKFLDLIEAKRDGARLSPEAIRQAVRSYTAREIPDYQMAAFLMAVHFRGMDGEETRVLTMAMRDSGGMLEFPEDPRPLVDKHSTGGVGDKVSLPLAPLLACLGFRVPMISGRGLGITGGTLDKLESIPGFSTGLSMRRIVTQVQSVGCAICGQTDEMVPADKALYALRDVTGTVPSLPLIAASILSKKLAEGVSALLLDVKFGGAAFMRTVEEARELARCMTTLGNECGVNTRAVLSGMDAPLGRSAGNWLEVREAVACLENRGPEDVSALVVECAACLLTQTGKARDHSIARAQAAACLASGGPRRKWDEMLEAQGADLVAFHKKLGLREAAPVTRTLQSETEGFVCRCDARVVGEIVRDLGGGRLDRETTIDTRVGIDRLAKPGERVGSGHVLGRVHARDKGEAGQAVERLRSAFVIGNNPPPAQPLIREWL